MTKDNRTLILAGLMVLSWFLPLSHYYNSNLSHFNTTKYYLLSTSPSVLLIEDIQVLAYFSIILLPLFYVLNHFDVIQTKKIIFRITLYVATLSIVYLFIKHYPFEYENSFFFIYHLMFFYFGFRVDNAIT